MNISKKRMFLWSLIWLGGLGTVWGQIPARGELISDTLLESYTLTEIAAEYAEFGLPQFAAPIQYEIDAYKIVYWTLNAQGNGLTQASGAVMIPKMYPCGATLVMYNHATVIYDEGLPSDLGMESIIGLPFGTAGYVVAMPDYLGLGESPGRHPFIHAKSEATCGVDMLRATKALCAELSMPLNEQLFIGGYSQGAHVSMAQFEEIEALHATEFDVTGVAVGGGPYDLSGTMTQFFFSGTPSVTTSYYFAYMMLAYQEVYGNLYNNLSEVFVAPYDTEIPLIFQRDGSQSGINLPAVATTMLQPSYIQAVQSDPNHPFNIALRDNDLYNWAPQSPLRMFYCEGDDVVPFENSIIAKDSMLANNAPNVDAVSVGPNNDHNTCILPSFLQIKIFVDTRRENCSTAIDPSEAIGLQIAPNPFSDQLQIEWQDVKIQSVKLLSLQGQVLQQQAVDRINSTTLKVDKLPNGIYLLELSGEDSRYFKKVMVQQ
ncbi:MAG: T9SS type A sorting domain-containing protein [Bacteroidota bacterium]